MPSRLYTNQVIFCDLFVNLWNPLVGFKSLGQPLKGLRKKPIQKIQVFLAPGKFVKKRSQEFYSDLLDLHHLRDDWMTSVRNPKRGTSDLGTGASWVVRVDGVAGSHSCR